MRPWASETCKNLHEAAKRARLERIVRRLFQLRRLNQIARKTAADDMQNARNGGLSSTDSLETRELDPEKIRTASTPPVSVSPNSRASRPRQNVATTALPRAAATPAEMISDGLVGNDSGKTLAMYGSARQQSAPTRSARSAGARRSRGCGASTREAGGEYGFK